MKPEDLSALLSAVLTDAVDAGDLPAALREEITPARVKVERPRSREHGDWATNVALQLGKKAGMAPRDLAGLVAERLTDKPGIAAVDVAGPGFLNVTLDAASAGALAREIVEAGPEYGRNDALAGHTVNMEFVSANPTGPLHIGHTRWAALGDAIARLLRASGADVTAEYYVNDAGNQMNVFADSVLARLHGRDVPAGGYPGAYVQELADAVALEHPDVRELTDEAARPVVREAAYRLQMQDIKDTLAAFDVHFDVFTSEQTLHDSGAIDQAVETEEEAFDYARRFLSYLPASVYDLPPTIPCTDDPERAEESLLTAVPRNRRQVYKMRPIIEAVVDKGSFFEVAANFGRPVITGLARIEGRAVLLLASDPFHYGGSWTSDACQKVVRWVDFAETFHLPVVYLMDCPGFMIGLEAEKSATIRHGVRAMAAVNQSTVPWCTIIIRNAFGVAGVVHQPANRFSMRYAWPSAYWGSLQIGRAHV